jgi:hypothetical protein
MPRCAQRSARDGPAHRCWRPRRISAAAAIPGIQQHALCARQRPEILTGPYTEDEFWEDLKRVTQGHTDQELARYMIAESKDMLTWIVDQGVRFQPARPHEFVLPWCRPRDAVPDQSDRPGTLRAMGLLLALHMGIVFALFITMPYGKFVHGFYRFLALVRYAKERRMV